MPPAGAAGPATTPAPAAHSHVAVEPGRAALGCRGEILRSPALDSDEPRAECRRRHPQARREGLGSDRVPARRAGRCRLVRTPGPRRRVHRRAACCCWSTAASSRAALLVVGRAADGSEVRRYPVRGTDLLSAQNRPSDHWFDPDGPWARPGVPRRAPGRPDRRRGRAGAGLGLPRRGWPRRPGGSSSGSTARVPASCRPQPFYVVGVESVLESEARRYAWDVTVRSSDQTAVSTALAAAGHRTAADPQQHVRRRDRLDRDRDRGQRRPVQPAGRPTARPRR